MLLQNNTDTIKQVGDNLQRLEEAIEWATTHERRDNFEEFKKLILE